MSTCQSIEALCNVDFRNASERAADALLDANYIDWVQVRWAFVRGLISVIEKDGLDIGEDQVVEAAWLRSTIDGSLENALGYRHPDVKDAPEDKAWRAALKRAGEDRDVVRRVFDTIREVRQLCEEFDPFANWKRERDAVPGHSKSPPWFGFCRNTDCRADLDECIGPDHMPNAETWARMTENQRTCFYQFRKLWGFKGYDAWVYAKLAIEQG
jgi:hypothetical protein